eukprot:2871381-Prymnesium_polylepis.1
MAMKWHPDKNREPGKEKRMEKVGQGTASVWPRVWCGARGGHVPEALRPAVHLASPRPRTAPRRTSRDARARTAQAERNFKLIARAYEVLGDKKTRADYDDGVDVDAPVRGR